MYFKLKYCCRLGDSEQKISILKLDVEGHELLAFPQFLQSDILKNVDQIHMEVRYVESKLVLGLTLFVNSTVVVYPQYSQ